MRPAAVVLCLAMAGLTGCGRDPHREMIGKQTAIFEEMADLLVQVKDAASIAAIEPKVAERMEALQRAANRTAAPPPPDPERGRAYEKEFLPKLKAAFARYRTELIRIRSLPGGAEFVERIGKMESGKTP